VFKEFAVFQGVRGRVQGLGGLALVCVAIAAGCASSQKQAQRPRDTGPVAAAPKQEAVDLSKPGGVGQPTADEELQSLDTNGDKQPDVFRFVVKGTTNKDGMGGKLVRKEIDLNHDGRIDIWKWFSADGVVERETFDLDFDQHIDVIAYYEKGVVVRKEAFHGGERPDTFKYYEKGRLVRVERDRLANDGKVDTWEYYEGDAIDRIGEDLDADGNVDNWIKRAQASK